MLKVYGSEMCPDCIECKFNLDRNNIEYENKDITKNLKYMKEFLRLRDKDTTFDDAKDNGYIGIPARFSGIICDNHRFGIAKRSCPSVFCVTGKFLYGHLTKLFFEDFIPYFFTICYKK